MSTIVTDTILEIAKLLLIICGIKMIFYKIKQRKLQIGEKGDRPLGVSGMNSVSKEQPIVIFDLRI